jgi:hypothetical protein
MRITTLRSREAFGDSVYYEYLASGKKAGTYQITHTANTRTESDFEFYETKYGAVIMRYTGSDTELQFPQQLGGMAVIGIGGPTEIGTGGVFARGDVQRITNGYKRAGTYVYDDEYRWWSSR